MKGLDTLHVGTMYTSGVLLARAEGHCALLHQVKLFYETTLLECPLLEKFHQIWLGDRYF